ncbi:MAG: DUF5655 domain-containing protein, partial [Desulfovibrio sp.]|nr:DUF5655 domain-containing protein [Desulfovibrio sp.]
VYRAGGLDFRNGTSMNAVCAMEESPDIHHVFPKRWCLDSGDPDVLARMDSIVNKTPLLPVSNRAIGGAAPRDYAQKIMKEAGIGEEELRKRVESHFVDWTAFMAGDFQRHFVQRAKRLLDLVGRAMGRVVADRGSAQTVERFGASLEDEGQGPEPGPVAEAPVDPRAEGGWASAPPEEASAGGGMQDGIPAVNASPAAASAWEELNRRVAALAPDVEIRPSPRQDYAAFLIQGRRFLAARLQKRDVKLFLGAKGGKLDDPQGLTVPSPWNQEGERQASIADAAGVEAAMPLVRQALELARTGGKAGAEETFTEEALLAAGGPEAAALYASLKARVLALGGVSVEPRKLYVAFKTDGRLFLSVTVLKSRLKIFFNVKKGALDDPDGLAEDVSAKGHWGPGDYQADAADEAGLDALMPLIRQSFEMAKA